MRDRPNRMLEFLKTPARPPGDACRSNRRRRTGAVVELSWPEGKGWRSIRARLRDISKGGAGVVAAVIPPRTRNARLRVEMEDGSPWIEVEILAVEPEGSRRNRIRLRFAEPCPNFLLRQAVLGAVDPEEEASGSRHEWAAWTS